MYEKYIHIARAEERRRMKYTHILYWIICILGILSLPNNVLAAENISEAGASAVLAYETPKKVIDTRPQRLEKFLRSIQSPMASSATHIVQEADRLGLDWKLIPAIAGNESYFGKHIPLNSHNGLGWGIYTGTSYGIQFNTWNDGITTVSEGLKKNYINRGLLSIDQIGKKYAADPLWSSKVRHFMNMIESYRLYQRDERLLALSL